MTVQKKIDNHWLDRMQEMVLLPVDDERRMKFEAEVARAGEAVKQAWLSLVYEEEWLRLELMEASPPPRLNEQILAIPNLSRQDRFSIRHWFLIGAAALILIICGLLFWRVGDQWTFNQNLHTLALLAMNDHVDEAHLDIKTNQKTELEKALHDQFSFHLALPELGSRYKLIGGRRCVLGTHPVLYSRWEGSNGECTLYQFQPSDFSLNSTMKRTLIQPKGPATERHPCEVLVWVQEEKGYILVADHGAMLKDVAIQ